MTTSKIILADFVEVRGRFRRSTHLEKDFGDAAQNGDYILTPTVRLALKRLVDGLGGMSTSRAWTLTGPYGVGKSAFAVFLTRLLCSTDKQGKQARHQLEQADPTLSGQLRKLGLGDTTKGFLPVLVTARRSPASKCLAEGIVAAAASTGDRKIKSSVHDLADGLNTQRNGQPLDSRQVVSSLSSLSESACASGYRGVLVIIDELGKLFEYAARYPQRGDVYVLQELAEHAARSGNRPIVLAGLLHQSFREYGIHLDQATRREWEKIQGRFEDIAFIEPAEQVIRMMAQAIRWNSDKGELPPRKLLGALSASAAKAGVVPPGMQKTEFEAVAQAAYPLHPVTLMALPFVFRRFAQNERSLFSFLSSMEPGGFQEFIKTHEFRQDSPPFIRIGDLFDYFTRSFGAGLYRHPHALRWMEAADILDRKEDLLPLHRELVKTIGMLNALGEFCHLSATEAVVSLAITDSAAPSHEMREALKYLTDSSVVTYRKFNHTYRIWEGSDVDIEERVAEGERKIRQGLHLADSVKRYLPARPMVARRHSFETGALRYFALEYVDEPDAMKAHFKGMEADGGGSDGKVLVCLAESPAVAEQFRNLAMEEGERQNVLFAIPQLIGELRSVVTELGALRWAWDNTPELRDDRVARREMSLRIADADQLLQRNVDGLLDPRDGEDGSGCLWIHAGGEASVRTPVDVSQLLSSVCDRIYDKAPRIRNELIARRSLSAAAAGARRNLVERMLCHVGEDALGIEGYPPERSMYESVLRATGIYRQDGDGKWGFHSPGNRNDTKIIFAWNCMRDALFGHDPEPIPLDRLFATLAAPPYGVVQGFHPVLLCAFMLAHPDETTLYREGTFLPEPRIADFEVLMRRPELFAIAGSRIAGGRISIVQRLAKGLKVNSATVPVVRALFGMVKALPDFAWNTRRLPGKALLLREAFQNAKSPEKFLFVDIPGALGLQAFSENALSKGEVDRFFDVLNDTLRRLVEATPNVINTARDSLLDACGFGAGETHWSELRHMAITLEPAVTDPHLLTFLRRVTQAGTDAAGIESVLALVANRPPRSWIDADAERFPEAAELIGRAFRQAVRTSGAGFGADAQLAALTPKERRIAEKTLLGVRNYLQRDANSASLAAVRAALTRLLEELEHGDVNK